MDLLARTAVDEISDGMTVGVGAGKTASRAIREIAARVESADLHGITVVPASDAAEKVCLELGLSVAESSSFESIDVLLDGADEVDEKMRMIKGSRGAVARERIIAAASARRIYLVPESKLSPRIGTNSALAVAVMPFGVASTRQAILSVGLHGLLRRDLNGNLLVTDNANLIVDVSLPATEDYAALANALDAIPGIVEHGLFLDEADEIMVERSEGVIDRMVRSSD
ncbi:MAG: ribose 5-phosphate isomerase A [Phycisphaerae bacterium]|nr:ribose 5-phosphate isomerase A [Phycisphaerae bacterium]